MILTSVLPGVMIGYGHGVTDMALSIFVVKVVIEIVVMPGMFVVMSRPRKSWGGLNLHLKCLAMCYRVPGTVLRDDVEALTWQHSMHA